MCIYVSSYCYKCVLILHICVLILLHLGPHTAATYSVLIQVKVLQCALIEAHDSYCYICVLILLYMCPHTTMCPDTTTPSALILLYRICVLILVEVINSALITAHNSWDIPVYVCPHTAHNAWNTPVHMCPHASISRALIYCYFCVLPHTGQSHQLRADRG